MAKFGESLIAEILESWACRINPSFYQEWYEWKDQHEVARE
jgi:hypothetical protein